jgi:hypothetical protein
MHWNLPSKFGSDTEQQERNKLIEQFQFRARSQRLRVTFVSGDVHCGAVGLFKAMKQKNGSEIAPADDHRYMVNIVTSECPFMRLVFQHYI